MSNKTSKNSIVLTLIIIFAFLFRILTINCGLVESSQLQNFYYDEFAIASRPVEMVLNNDLNPYWFIESTWYKYAIFIPLYLTKFFTSINLVNAIVIGRLISILFALLTIILVYYIGKEIYDERLGLIASLFMSINPNYFYYSTLVKEDSMVVFFITFAIYYFIKYIKYEKIYLFYISMFIGGLATSTKYPAGLTIIPFTIFFIFKNYKNLNLTYHIKTIFISAFAFIFGFVLLTPYSILSFKEFSDGALWE